MVDVIGYLGTSLPAVLSALSSPVGVAAEGFTVFLGLDVVVGSLRASFRDKNWTTAELVKFVHLLVKDPLYRGILGLLAAAALAPEPTSQSVAVGLLTLALSGATVRIASSLLDNIRGLAGFVVAGDLAKK